MMIIKKIEFSNFRNIKNWKISFNQGLNVFVGVNSAWKTNLFNLLKFIKHLLYSGDIEVAFNKINRNFFNIDKTNDTWKIKISFKINTSAMFPIFEKDSKEIWIIQNEELELELEFKQIDYAIYIHNFKWTIKFRKQKLQEVKMKKIPKLRSRIQTETILNKQEYYDHFAMAMNIFNPWESFRKKTKFKLNEVKSVDISSNLSKNDTTNQNFKEWFLRSIKPILLKDNFHFININPIEARKPISISETEKNPAMLSENWSNLPIFLDSILKDKESKEALSNFLEIDLPFISNITTSFDEQTGYTFIRIKENNKDVHPSRISDWTIDYLAYLSIIVKLNQKSKGWQILFIEEIERNLHYNLLWKLVWRFKNELVKNWNQIFITSHSMNMLNYLKLEEVFLLKKENNYTKIEWIKRDKTIKKLLEVEPLGNLFLDNEINYE